MSGEVRVMGPPSRDLLAEQRNDRAPTAGDIAEPGARDHRVAIAHVGCQGDPLADQLGRPHDIAGADGLVRTGEHHPVGPVVDGGIDDIAETANVDVDRRPRRGLATGHMLDRRGMENQLRAHQAAVDLLALGDVAMQQFDARIAGKRLRQVIETVLIVIQGTQVRVRGGR